MRPFYKSIVGIARGTENQGGSYPFTAPQLRQRFLRGSEGHQTLGLRICDGSEGERECRIGVRLEKPAREPFGLDWCTGVDACRL